MMKNSAMKSSARKNEEMFNSTMLGTTDASNEHLMDSGPVSISKIAQF